MGRRGRGGGGREGRGGEGGEERGGRGGEGREGGIEKGTEEGHESSHIKLINPHSLSTVINAPDFLSNTSTIFPSV